MTLRRTIIMLIAIAASLLLQGCIRESYTHCELSLDVTFFSSTVCQPGEVYPDEIEDLLLCVFDNEDVLVEYRKIENVTLSSDYIETVDINSSGLYYVVAWSGVNEALCDVNELTVGETKRTDLLFRLKRAQVEAYSLDGEKIYFGASRAVYVPDIKGIEKYAEEAPVNMQEVTNRLRVSVEGLMESVNNCTIDIETNSTSMEVCGDIYADDQINYGKIVTRDEVNNVLIADFTTLKLETGYVNTIVITNNNDGTEIFRGSLLGSLLLKNPFINLNCDNDFVIAFTANDSCNCGTYTITEVRVNDWLISSYDIGM